jgi:hypothetical protein
MFSGEHREQNVAFLVQPLRGQQNIKKKKKSDSSVSIVLAYRLDDQDSRP